MCFQCVKYQKLSKNNYVVGPLGLVEDVYQLGALEPAEGCTA